MHALVSGVVWDQLRDAMMWMQLLCNPATLQPVSLWGEGTQGGRGGQSSHAHRGSLATP